jgi:hypothetical protein
MFHLLEVLSDSRNEEVVIVNNDILSPLIDFYSFNKLIEGA